MISKKKDVESISNLLPLYSFKWKESGKKSYGFIAQYLEKTNPELVSEDSESKHVDYNAALSLCVAQLSNIVEDNKLKIKELEAKILELERRLT